MACAVLEEEEDGKRVVDFNKLIPEPITMYHGDLSGKDSNDFSGHNWSDWHRANWNTKWNAYKSEFNDDEFWIKFETAWSIPYPIIVAVANTLKHSSFVHAYVCEYGEFWGTEVWENQNRILIDGNFMKAFLKIYSQETFDEIQEEYAANGHTWPDEDMLAGKHCYQ